MPSDKDKWRDGRTQGAEGEREEGKLENIPVKRSI